MYVNKRAPINQRYISPDKTGHTGANQWKAFNVKGARTGTYKLANGKLVYIRR